MDWKFQALYAIILSIMKELIDADTFKIEMKDSYSPVYMTCIDEAKKDKQNNARPELTDYLAASMSMTPSFLATRITGELSRWQSQLSWKDMTSPERQSFPFVPMKEAEWDPVRVILKSLPKEQR